MGSSNSIPNEILTRKWDKDLLLTFDAFELWCWRRLLRVPWTVRRSNSSVLKEINPEYSLEGLMLKLNLQYFGHLMRRADSLEKTLMLGKIEGKKRRRDRGWDGWMASPTQWTWIWANSGRWWRSGKHGMLQSMGSQRVRHYLATEQLNFAETCFQFSSVQSLSHVWLTLCDPMNCSTPGLPVHHQLPEFMQTQVHRVGDAIQPSHPLSSPSPPAPNPSQHQSLFQWSQPAGGFRIKLNI